MSQSRQDEINKLIQQHRRHLQILEEKKARVGIDHMPPGELIHIDEINEQLENLEAQLEELQASAGSRLVEVTVEGEYSNEMIEAAKRAFAGVLNTSPNNIKVAYIRKGSVVLLFQMSNELAQQLVELYETGELGFEGLTIQDVKRLTSWQEVKFSYESRLGKLDFTRADLSGANLREVNLIKAYLREADLSGANLNRALLNGAYLFRAQLFRAYLVRAILRGAILKEADLRKADLSGANLNRADLSEANLTDARYTRRTQWPDDFDPAAAGAVLVE